LPRQNQGRRREHLSMNDCRWLGLGKILEWDRTVIFGPPGEMSPANDVLKDEPDDTPGDIIDSVGRWDRIRPSKDDTRQTCNVSFKL